MSPRLDAVTVYDPSTSLGSARELAWPLAMTTEEVDNSAEAPLAAGLAMKVTTPPSTGSTGLLAVTVTASGLVNGVAVVRRLRGAAGDGGDGEALALEGADVDEPLTMRGRPRWSVVTPGGMSALCRRRSPGCRGAGGSFRSDRHSCRGSPARVGDADKVAVNPIQPAPRAAGADQVIRA